MSRASKRSRDRSITLSSGRCAELARQFEDQDATAVIPSTLLRALLEEARGCGGADVPRYDVVELDPEELMVIDEIFDEAFSDDVAAAGSGGR
ncbi:MAG TPA: hypothetical protein VIF15_00785 [Polyangiaceae bacterium]|jgi:hypothetical protein